MVSGNLVLNKILLGLCLLVFNVAAMADSACDKPIEDLRTWAKTPAPNLHILGETYDEKMVYYSVVYIEGLRERQVYIKTIFLSKIGCAMEETRVGLDEKRFLVSRKSKANCESDHSLYNKKVVGDYFYYQDKYSHIILEHDERYLRAPASKKDCYFLWQHLYKPLSVYNK
ncbi:hypothetical protein DU000_10720 [Parvibium lacunae]|uniref:Uncharacterized protein n=2 Tax=Parvibium lacunae TaxID=1888893 RepID=A0A368KZS4_9BURK|nr:hypothetical protein DU000_10720 [Parvibium lacunae]